MRKNIFTAFGTVVVLTFAAFLSGGCSSMPGKMSLPSFAETSSPSQIVAVWDPAIRHEDGKAYRGLYARVIFYDSSSRKALRVKGDFDIYVFDEDDKEKKKKDVPSKIVRYQAGDLKHLESDSKLLGKSYTVWVPWDEVTDDSKKKRLSLFVRFKSTDGTGVMVVSHQATLDLPGNDPDEQLEETVVGNPYLEDKKMLMDKLENLAAQRRNNRDLQGVEEWKGTVAEHMITRENRPQAMVTTTINMPGISRDGLQNVTREQRFASATDEQKYQAQLMLANARQNQQLQQQQNLQQPQINQVQFQSSGEPTFRPVSAQTIGGLTPLDEAALLREFQLRQQQLQQQNPPQQPIGNYAAIDTGVVWR